MKLDKRKLRKHPHDEGWWYFRSQTYAELVMSHLFFRGGRLDKEHQFDSEPLDSEPLDSRSVRAEWLDEFGSPEDADIMYLNKDAHSADSQEIGVWQVQEETYKEFYESIERQENERRKNDAERSETDT